MAPSSPSPPLLPLADPSGLLATPATRAAQACQGCRKRKARCINFVDGSCQLCREKGVPCEMAPNMAKDRAAQSRARNEENELLRQQMGPEAVLALLQGSGVDAEAALLRLGRLDGRVGGSGPAGSLEDLKRVCHQTDNGAEFIPNATDSLLLAHLSTVASDLNEPDAYDQYGFDVTGRWVWTSGTVPRSETFDRANDDGELPTKAECETHVDFFFEHLHPLMPMLSEAQVRRWLSLLWDDTNERDLKSWFPWSRSAGVAETAAAEPHRSPLDTEVAQFVSVLFAVMACAASAASGASDVSARYHTLAIRSMHLSTLHYSSSASSPQLHQIQVMALLSNHLASLGYLSGAWTASKYGARLLQERGLHLSAKHGHGVDAEIRCRTFWCLFNLDRALGRVLGKPFQIALPLTGGPALPLTVDEGTELWASYFDDNALLPADYDPSAARISGFILLCKLADLGARVVKDLYPPGRDRSQDWRLTGVRTMLASAIEGWLWELSLIEDEVGRTFGDDHNAGDDEDEQAEAVEAVVRNLALDVRLLVYRVQLPRSSQRGHLATNAFSLEPQLAVARQVVAVPVANRLAVPRSIYTVQETTTVFMALFPLLYSQLADADGEAGEHESVERDIRFGLACLKTLATAWRGTTLFAEAGADLAQLVAATARRAAGTTSKKGKKRAPPKLEGVSKGKGFSKTEPSSAGFPLAPPAMVDMSLNSPGPRIVSPRSAGRYQPYPQSPPGQPLLPLRLKPDPRKTTGGGGRQRSRTVGSGGDANLGRSLSRSRPQPMTRHPRAAQPTVLIDASGHSDNDSFSPSSLKEPHTPPGLGSATGWSSQDERSSEQRGRPRELVEPASRRGFSAPLSLYESPILPPQPLGYGDDSDTYDMDDDGDHPNSADGDDGGYPHAATYAIPPLQHPLPSSSAGLTTPHLKDSPVIPASFPSYDRFAASLAYDRSRQHQHQQTPASYTPGPWESSHYSEAYYRPAAPSSSFYRAPAPSQPPTASQGSLSAGFAHYAPFQGSQGGAGVHDGGHPTYGSYDPVDGLFYPAESPPRPSVAPASYGQQQHAHPSALQYHPSQHAHHRRR